MALPASSTMHDKSDAHTGHRALGVKAFLAAEPDPEAACTQLVAQANEAGGRDNITVLIVRFDPA